MTEIRFYHLERSDIMQTLPALLTKALSQGDNIIVQTDTVKHVEAINTHLWTFDAGSFLPHGAQKDGNAERQPIWITDKAENPNAAQILILVNGATNDNMGEYKLCCEMLDGRDTGAVQAARERWKIYKEQGFTITYWQQGLNGGWEKKV